MSLTLLVWYMLFFGYMALSLTRPVYALPVYFISFFAHPAWWWWGRQGGIAYYRWSLYGGLTLVGALLLANALPYFEKISINRKALVVLALMALNAILVHVTLAKLAPWPEQAGKPFSLFLKFSLLHVLIVAAIRSRKDFAVVAMTLCLGVGYWGWEVWWNKRGMMRRGRLEGLGGPGATDANHMASVLVTILPLCGALIFTGKPLTKIVSLFICALTVNTILLCNSRGAFLAVITSGIVLLICARGKLRKRALIGLTLGSIMTYMLMGDPQILERFMTTFAGSEERDGAASSRLDFWTAGLKMLHDWPFGAGGDGFKRAGGPYMSGAQVYSGRAIHNGFLCEASEWGYQGLFLRLVWISMCCWSCFKTMDYQRQPGRDENMAFYGACTMAAVAAFLAVSVFGDYIDNEWGYWICALCIAYSRNYGASLQPAPTWSEVLRQRYERAKQATRGAHHDSEVRPQEA